jgi:hypothetical protein
VFGPYLAKNVTATSKVELQGVKTRFEKACVKE